MNFKEHKYNFSVIDEDCYLLSERTDLTDFINKTVLITGANGLIGGFLSDLFCYLNDKKDYNIKICLTSYSNQEKAHRISRCIQRSDVKYFSWDCSHPVNTDLLPQNIDYTFFCSGYGQPSKFLIDSIKTAMINVVGLESLLKHVSQSPGGKFLFLSTSEIYGNPPINQVPTPEKYEGNSSLENNRASYINSKRLGEVICSEYKKLLKMEVRCARIALCYGPGVLRSDGRVLQDFIFKAASRKEIEMLDEGTSMRQYIYISDCVEILLNSLLRGKHFVYNVGGDTEPVSIYELAKTVGSFFDADVIKGTGIKTHKNIKSAPTRVGLDMQRYRKEFSEYGFHITSLYNGIKNTIRWFDT